MPKQNNYKPVMIKPAECFSGHQDTVCCLFYNFYFSSQFLEDLNCNCKSIYNVLKYKYGDMTVALTAEKMPSDSITLWI